MRPGTGAPRPFWKNGRKYRMTPRNRRAMAILLATAALTAPAMAADVTPDRLVNADREPGNWLMNHRTYDAQRFSPLERINTGNVRSLKLAYAVLFDDAAITENLQ